MKSWQFFLEEKQFILNKSVKNLIIFFSTHIYISFKLTRSEFFEEKMLIITKNVIIFLGLLCLIPNCSSSNQFNKRLYDKDVLIRREAALQLSVLAQTHDANKYYEHMVNAFQDKDSVVRYFAIKSMGRVNPRNSGVLVTLRVALRDQSTEVKRAAAVALTSMSPFPTVAYSPLIKALADPDETLRQYIRSSLIDHGSLAVTSLVYALQDPEPKVRKECAEILGEIGAEAKSAIPKLEALLEDEDETVRFVALQSINQLQASRILR